MSIVKNIFTNILGFFFSWPGLIASLLKIVALTSSFQASLGIMLSLKLSPSTPFFIFFTVVCLNSNLKNSV